MFGGGEEASSSEATVGDVEHWRHMWGARVKWPVEMPDDILKHAIGATTQIGTAPVISLAAPVASVLHLVLHLACVNLEFSQHGRWAVLTGWVALWLVGLGC